MALGEISFQMTGDSGQRRHHRHTISWWDNVTKTHSEPIVCDCVLECDCLNNVIGSVGRDAVAQRLAARVKRVEQSMASGYQDHFGVLLDKLEQRIDRITAKVVKLRASITVTLARLERLEDAVDDD